MRHRRIKVLLLRHAFESTGNDFNKLKRHHSSVDSSVPYKLLPQVQVPNTPSMLFSIYIVQIVYSSFELECEKNENLQKEAGIGRFFKKIILFKDANATQKD